MSRGLSTGGRRVAYYDHDAARRWTTRMLERFAFLCATLRIRAVNGSRCCYVSVARCTSPRGTRTDGVGPVRGCRSVRARATPIRVCRRTIRTWRWSPQTTAPVSDAGSRRFQVTHPYHPLHLQEFELVLHAQNWHEDRVWFHDANDRLRALPANWTSVVGEDPFNVVAGGRALFRVEELLELGHLIATLEPGSTRFQCNK